MWCRRRELLLSLGGLSLTSCRDNASERTVAYGSHPAQTYNLYKPSGAGNRRLIVLIHGGGWHQGSREDTAWLVPRLLPEGYTVANLGYRQLADAPAPAAAEDVRHGLAHIRRTVDEADRQTAIIGFSAGAHLALLAVSAPTGQVGGPQSAARAVVSFWGITDVYDLAVGPNVRDFARQWVGTGAGAEELARKLSPVYYEAPPATAVLAIHSTRDPVVPYAHSERLVSAWQKSGRSAELVRLDNEGHGAERSAFPSLLTRVHEFIRRTLSDSE